MSEVIARSAGPRLVPGRDLHIIGCRRPVVKPRKTACIGLRWASRVDLGFPGNGYRITRHALPEGPAHEIGIFFLPDTSSWQAFAKDARARRAACGPYFSDFDEKTFGPLLPVIRLCDPRTPPGEIPGLVERAAEFFGDTHRGDAELAFNFWRFGKVPTLADLLQDPSSALAVIAFYRRAAMALILVLALRFEYAVLFGLATDDPDPGKGDVVYMVQATFGAAHGQAESDPVLTNAACAPSAPAWAAADRQPGGVLYPAYSIFADWMPPAGFGPTDEEGVPLDASASWPKVPAALTGLSWAEPPPEPNLIGHGPVLYRIGRYAHGAATAAMPTTPMLPPGAVFAPLDTGEDIIRGRGETHFIDTPIMPWPPLEGHYHYQVRGVDLLGVVSPGAALASVRHHDDLPPPAPRAVNEGGTMFTLDERATSIELPIRIDWDAGEDFGGPDVVEFRVAASFRALRAVGLHVQAASDVDALHADLTIASLPLPANALRGTQLSLPSGDYPIVSHGSGAPATLRVRKVLGRLPSAGEDGLVLAPAQPTPLTRVGRLPRRPMVPAKIAEVMSVSPAEIELSPATAAAIPDDETVQIYLHLLGASFAAHRIGPARYRLDPPRPESPAQERWLAWSGLGDPKAAMRGSPALVFPPHRTVLTLSLPIGFQSGSLTLQVTAADGAAYVASPALPVADPVLAQARGNESARSPVMLSVRSLSPPPGEVTVDPYDPFPRKWASSAANYAEDGTYRLSWPPVSGAARYEVWRVLETAIPGVTPATGDGALRMLAASASFALRSDRVFGTSYVDAIPGRAPVRALYRVRAVSPAGTMGGFSDVIGPVYVPDVRQPPAPNLLRVAAVPPEEAERAIALEWTQSGSAADVRFDIWYRETGDDAAPMLLAGSLPAGAASSPGGRHRFLHPGRRPGRFTAYEVRAVREALDPIDPNAVARRDIASSPSRRLAAAALASGPLQKPTAIQAAAGPAGVTLSWSLADDYEAIEIRRRAPERFGFELVARVAGDATTFLDTPPGAGSFTYQVRALGNSRVVNGDEQPVVEVA